MHSTTESTVAQTLQKIAAQTQMGQRGLLNTREVCALLGKSKMTLSRWTRDGKIPHYRLNGLVCFDPGHLLHWLKQRNLTTC